MYKFEDVGYNVVTDLIIDIKDQYRDFFRDISLNKFKCNDLIQLNKLFENDIDYRKSFFEGLEAIKQRILLGD